MSKNLKILVETVNVDNLEFLTEEVNSKKIYRIHGIFAQSEIKNKNGRVYPRYLMEREVNRYNKEKIVTCQALGELEHGPEPTINLDRVSHLVEKLEMNGSDVIGTAILADTPCGKIAKALIDCGAKLGVSTRALGTTDYNGIVNENFHLICADIVSNPSAPNAIVDALIESKEYIIENNTIIEVAYNKLEDNLNKHGSKVLQEQLKMFFNSLKGA